MKKKTKHLEMQLEKAQQEVKAFRTQLGLPAAEVEEESTEEAFHQSPTKQQRPSPSSSSSSSSTYSDAEYIELQQRMTHLEKDYAELQNEYSLQALSFEEKAGAMRKTLTEIDQIESEKYELEKKSQSLSIESSS